MKLYNDTIRPYLPTRMVKCELNGIKTYRPFKLFDLTQLWPDMPDYEKSFIDSILSVATNGLSVTIIGGGNGVSTVKTARKVGITGKVITYEASNRQFTACKIARKLNRNPGNIKLKKRLIGEPVNVYGDMTGVLQRKPENLEVCDILALDCEGSELDILQRLTIRPKWIIVEIHERYDFIDREIIFGELFKKGYTAIEYKTEAPDIPIITFEYEG